MMYSLFNVVKSQGEDTWIFNTLKGSFVKIASTEWENVFEYEELKEALFNQGILVHDNNIELYEYKLLYYNSMFKSDYLSLAIAPTMNCNFYCHYCFEEGNKHGGIMKDDVEDALIEYLVHNKDKIIKIVWFGGEPLLGFNKILSISKHLHNNNIKFSSNIVTNGSLLDEFKINNLGLLNLDFIQITLDGIFDKHDSRRFFQGKKPSFEIIINNIRNLLEKTDIKLHIQVTVDKTNFDAYDDVVSYFEKEFPTYMSSKRVEIGVNVVLNRTNFEKHNECFSLDEIMLRYRDNIQKNKFNNINIALPSPMPSCMYRNIRSFAIDPKGNMYKCLEFLGSDKHVVGNICKKTLSMPLLSKAVFEKDCFDDKQCLSCNVLPICSGGCPIDRIKNRDFCSVYKDRLVDVLPDIYNAYSMR